MKGQTNPLGLFDSLAKRTTETINNLETLGEKWTSTPGPLKESRIQQK